MSTISGNFRIDSGEREQEREYQKENERIESIKKRYFVLATALFFVALASILSIMTIPKISPSVLLGGISLVFIFAFLSFITLLKAPKK